MRASEPARASLAPHHTHLHMHAKTNNQLTTHVPLNGSAVPKLSCVHRLWLRRHCSRLTSPPAGE